MLLPSRDCHMATCGHQAGQIQPRISSGINNVMGGSTTTHPASQGRDDAGAWGSFSTRPASTLENGAGRPRHPSRTRAKANMHQDLQCLLSFLHPAPVLCEGTLTADEFVLT